MILSLILLLLVWLLPSEGRMVCEQRQQSQMLKFVASLIVVVGHETCFYTSLPKVVANETSAGSLCVAFFLFMSGYGLLYGFLKKRQRLDVAWIGRRMVKLVVPALTAMSLYLVVEMAVGREIDWNGVLKYWFVSDCNLRYGWYVCEILILYVAFWLCFRSLSWHRAFTILFVVVMAAMVIMIVCKCARWYIEGLPAFLLGMWMACGDVGCRPFQLPGKFRPKLFATVAVAAFCLVKNFHAVQAVVPVLDRWRYEYTAFYLCDFLFVVIVVYLLKRLPSCRVMANRGGYFYEVYLIQGATLLFCRELTGNDVLFVFVGLLVTVAVAKVMSWVNGRIIGFFKLI